MELPPSRYLINLSDQIVFIQDIHHLCKSSGLHFQFKITGDGPADLLRVDNGRILFYNSSVFKGADPGLNRYPGQPDRFPDIRLKT